MDKEKLRSTKDPSPKFLRCIVELLCQFQDVAHSLSLAIDHGKIWQVKGHVLVG